ncbi:UNVERIFIED_CONTAM: hypothetical protein Sradi_4842200 [Sesamum radiatum]|uniref:Uncharacterized protein n=1 Tax=Sesamum radiatum TaxID=300843 RepID=A0AAW2MZD9_SESRA
MYQQCGGKKSMLKFYYKDPTLPLEWGIRPIKEECPDLCLVDLQNCHRIFDVPVNIYVEEEEAEPLQAIDSQGNPIEKEQEEEIRFLLEGIDFEELGGNEIEGDGRKDCEGQGVEGVEFEGDGRQDCEGQGIEGQGLDRDEVERSDCEGQGVEVGVDDNFIEIPIQQKDSNKTDNVTENVTKNITENVTEIPVQNITEKGKRKLYERFLNESSSEFDDSSDEDYVQSGEGSDSETPSLVLEDIECDSDDDIFLLKDPIRKCNPGSKLLLRKVENSDPPVFDRMYFSLWALKKGFLEGCRPIIGLDGCFLKIVYGGQLLGCGKGWNDNMFPIAMAVVQVENRDTWAIGSKRARLDDYVDDCYTKLQQEEEDKAHKQHNHLHQDLQPRLQQTPAPMQQQVGYQGPRNASLLGNVNPASSSVPATRRYNKRPSISEVLDKMKERQKRRQQD